MTKQEQIEEMAHIMCKHYNKGFCAKGDITEICEDMPYCCYKNDAEALYDAGYGNVSEYKAERELLGSQIKVLKQRLNNKYIEIDNLNRDYHNSFERLKAQEREIMQLKAENERFENNMKNVLEIEKKQAKIDVLNELKKKTHNYYSSIDSYCISQHIVLVRDIDELLKEYENGKDKD